MTAPLTRTLALGATAMGDLDLPADVRLIAKSSILDWLGVTIAAANEPAVHALRETLPMSGEGASVVGISNTASPTVAARINGTAGHLLDFDDVISPFGHPTVPVLPAVLALGQVRASSGADILKAFVLGVETECRVGASVGPEHYEHGFHSTATNGIFGAAVASAYLLGLSTEETMVALGLASTSASGLKSAFGTWGKSLQVGHAAAEGVLAAQLALRAATSSAVALEGPQGYVLTHTSEPNIAAGLAPLGDPWAIRGMLFKYFASCYGTHSSIAALIGLRDAAGTAAVERIELGISRRHLGMCDQANVTTVLQAKFSLAFTSAMAWKLGRVTSHDFTDAVVADPSLQELSSRVVLRPGDQFDFSETAVRVVLHDGRELVGGVDTSIPATGDGINEQWNRLTEKFHALTDEAVGEARANRIITQVENLEELSNISKLCQFLAL